MPFASVIFFRPLNVGAKVQKICDIRKFFVQKVRFLPKKSYRKSYFFKKSETFFFLYIIHLHNVSDFCFSICPFLLVQ